jgi:hypothetical protein
MYHFHFYFYNIFKLMYLDLLHYFYLHCNNDCNCAMVEESTVVTS